MGAVHIQSLGKGVTPFSTFLLVFLLEREREPSDERERKEDVVVSSSSVREQEVLFSPLLSCPSKAVLLLQSSVQ